jgi:hypothetical protein
VGDCRYLAERIVRFGEQSIWKRWARRLDLTPAGASSRGAIAWIEVDRKQTVGRRGKGRFLPLATRHPARRLGIRDGRQTCEGNNAGQ